MGFEIAGNPASAVEEDDRRRCPRHGPIDPRGKRPGAAPDLDIFYTSDRRWRHGRATGFRQCADRVARALWRHRPGVAQGEQWNDLGNHGIERLRHFVISQGLDAAA